MKFIYLFSTLLILFTSQAEDKYSHFKRQQPTKCDGIYINRMKHFNKVNADAPKGGIVLLGDSMTQAFPEKAVPSEWKLTARGISGDGIGGGDFMGLINRLHASCHELKPKKVFIKIGINDLLDFQLGLEGSPEELRLKTYAEVFKEIREHNPGVKIYISSVLPVRNKGAWSTKHDFASFNNKIDAFNKKLKQVAKENKVYFVDLHSKFENEDGQMKDELTRDGVHLTGAGYDLMIEELTKVVEHKS